jgi:hypothetical protein
LVYRRFIGRCVKTNAVGRKFAKIAEKPKKSVKINQAGGVTCFCKFANNEKNIATGRIGE